MSSSPSVATVTPARAVRGAIRVPGDKSISHRYAILAAIADGRTVIRGYSSGADCASTLACVRTLGVAVDRADTDTLTLLGRGSGRLSSPSAALDAGNSGTTMRLLAGVLAAQPFESRLVGDASLSRRPMRRIMDPLSAMGARIDAVDGHAPLTIHGGPLHGAAHRLASASAQVKSALLLAGIHAEGETSVTEPAATRDHTERALAAFNAPATVARGTVRVRGGQRLTPPARLVVPGDFSSAAYWLVAAAALPGSNLRVDDVGLNPTRTALLDVLRRFGARVAVHVADEDGGEPRGTIAVEAADARPITIGPDEVPLLIDELPAIAALAAFGGEVTIRGAAELRVKESDRIATLVAGMRAIGIDADEYPDGFTVTGRARPAGGGAADAQGDHRMAMAFAIAALAAERPSKIAGAESVAISYPGFFETLARLVA